MPTYVTLFRYSSEGFKDLSEERRQQQISLIESHGGQVKEAYGLMGEWDVLIITEFPDFPQRPAHHSSSLRLS